MPHEITDDFDKYINMSDYDFIMSEEPYYWSQILLPADYSSSGKSKIRIDITRGGFERHYTPDDYLFYRFQHFENILHSEKNIHKKYDIALNAKAFVSQQVEFYKSMLFGVEEPVEKYDFSPKINIANQTFEYVKGLIDGEEQKARIKNLQREKWKFWLGFLFGAITSGVALWGVYLKWLQCN